MDASVICWTSLMFADASTVMRCTSRASSIEVWITWYQKSLDVHTAGVISGVRKGKGSSIYGEVQEMYRAFALTATCCKR